MVYIYEQTATVTVTVPANTPAGTPQTCTISYGTPTPVSTQTVTIPSTQSWEIIDVFIKSSTDVGVDGQIVVYKNDIKPMLVTDPVSAMLISNPSRPRYPILFYEPMSRLRITFIPLAATGSSAATVTFFIKIRVTDTTF